jgi:hypothetical protein
MKEKKDLPTLSDSDIVTNDDRKKVMASNPMKLSTIALALALTTATGTMLTSCSDNSDCDSDTTHYADPAADSYDQGAYDTGVNQDSYDYGQYDTSDSDTSNYADAKPCD